MYTCTRNSVYVFDSDAFGCSGGRSAAQCCVASWKVHANHFTERWKLSDRNFSSSLLLYRIHTNHIISFHFSFFIIVSHNLRLEHKLFGRPLTTNSYESNQIRYCFFMEMFYRIHITNEILFYGVCQPHIPSSHCCQVQEPTKLNLNHHSNSIILSDFLPSRIMLMHHRSKVKMQNGENFYVI